MSPDLSLYLSLSLPGVDAPGAAGPSLLVREGRGCFHLGHSDPLKLGLWSLSLSTKCPNREREDDREAILRGETELQPLSVALSVQRRSQSRRWDILGCSLPSELHYNDDCSTA